MSQDSSFERKNVFEIIEDDSSKPSTGDRSEATSSNQQQTSASSPVEIEAGPGDNANDAIVISKSPTPQKAAAKKRAKPRRKRRAKNYDDSDSGDGAVDPRAKQLFKKYATTSKGRGAGGSGGGAASGKSEIGPYIRATGVEEKTDRVRFSIVNSATSDGASGQANLGRAGVLEPHFYDLASCDPDLPWLCCFCRRPPYYNQLSYLYGPYPVSGRCRDYLMSDPHEHFPEEKAYRKVKDEPSEEHGPLAVWFHWECFLFTNGCYFLNKLIGLDDAVKVAVKTKCALCKQLGATLSCCMKNCSKTYHYMCGREADASFNEEYCTIFCHNHKGGFQAKRSNSNTGEVAA